MRKRGPDRPDLRPAGPDRRRSRRGSATSARGGTTSSSCGCSTRPRSSSRSTRRRCSSTSSRAASSTSTPTRPRAEYLRRVRRATPPRSSGRASTWGSSTSRSRPTGRWSSCCSTCSRRGCARGRRPGRRAGAGAGRGAMSFLTPLYVLGAARHRGADRVPPDPPDAPGRGAVQLADVPRAHRRPRLTRRSRLDNSLLLLLRATGPRPAGLRVRPAVPRAGGAARLRRRERRRVAVLIDTSASMRRGDLWPRAKALAAEVDRRLPARPTSSPSSPSTRRRGRCSASTNRRRSTRRGGRPSPGRGSTRLAPTWGATAPGPGPDRRRRRDRGRGRRRARRPAGCRAGSS